MWASEVATMDRTGCAEVERVPGTLGGAPVVRHSRVRPEDLVANAAEGEEWLAEAYGQPLATVRAILAFHRQHRAALASPA